MEFSLKANHSSVKSFRYVDVKMELFSLSECLILKWSFHQNLYLSEHISLNKSIKFC